MPSLSPHLAMCDVSTPYLRSADFVVGNGGYELGLVPVVSARHGNVSLSAAVVDIELVGLDKLLIRGG